MLSSLWIKSTLTLIFVAIIVMGSCRMMNMAGCRPIKPPHTYTVTGTVLSVEAANQFTLKVGRRTRGVTMAYLAVKDESGGLAITSRLLPVGASVSVEVEGRKVFGDEAQAGQRRLDGGQESDATAEAQEPPEARGPINDANEWTTWFDEHVKGCQMCAMEGSEENGPPPLCEAAFTKMQEILRKGMVEVDCPDCGGTGKSKTYPSDDCFLCSGDGKIWRTPEPPEARGNLTGIVTGPTGADVGLELIRDGKAVANPGAPKSYIDGELSAKKSKKGIWAK